MLELGAYIYATRYSESQRQLTHWYNGIHRGLVIGYSQNGSICGLQQRRRGLRDAVMTSYHSNGSISFISYEYHIKRYVICFGYWPDGSIQLISIWRHGLRHGIQIAYSSYGFICEVTYWHHGKQIDLSHVKNKIYRKRIKFDDLKNKFLYHINNNQ